jgi:hypothetical protein
MGGMRASIRLLTAKILLWQNEANGKADYRLANKRVNGIDDGRNAN